MPKDPWRNYATSKRLERKGYFKKYIYGGEGRQTTEASCGDCIEQSREVQEEIEQKEEVMPLVKGKGEKAIRQNIEIEEKIGKKPKKQAVAIALNKAKKSKEK